MRIMIFVLAGMLPWAIRRIVLCVMLGYKIDKTAYISRLSIVVPDELEMGASSYIGAMSMIKGMRRVQVGECGYIGALNWIYGFPGKSIKLHFADVQRVCQLVVCRHASVTSRHIIDCTDEVIIGEYSTVAGYRTQILTHSIDLHESRQNCKPVHIGRYCFIGTDCVLLGGASLPDYSVLAAHSLYSMSQAESYYYYGGVPARQIKPVDKGERYFTRKRGYVD